MKKQKPDKLPKRIVRNMAASGLIVGRPYPFVPWFRRILKRLGVIR